MICVVVQPHGTGGGSRVGGDGVARLAAAGAPGRARPAARACAPVRMIYAFF